MSQKDINHVGTLFKCNSKPKLWEELKNELNYQGQLQFINKQIIQSFPKSCKDGLIPNIENIENLVFQGCHLTKTSSSHCLKKMNRNKIYSILIESGDSKPFAIVLDNVFFKIQILIKRLCLCYLV